MALVVGSSKFQGEYMVASRQFPPKQRLFRVLACVAVLAGGFATTVAFGTVPAAADEVTISHDDAVAICKDYTASLDKGRASKTRAEVENDIQTTYSGPHLSDQCADSETGVAPATTTIQDICDLSYSATYFQLEPKAKSACATLCTSFAGLFGHNCSDANQNEIKVTPPDQKKSVPDGINVQHVSELTNGLLFYALLACLGGILVSASLWAMGSKGQNPGTELTGKKGLIVCCTAAFLIGALPAWTGYLEDLAKSAAPETSSAAVQPVTTYYSSAVPVPTAANPADPKNKPQVENLLEEYNTLNWDKGLNKAKCQSKDEKDCTPLTDYEATKSLSIRAELKALGCMDLACLDGK